MTYLWLFIFEELCKCTSVPDLDPMDLDPVDPYVFGRPGSVPICNTGSACGNCFLKWSYPAFWVSFFSKPSKQLCECDACLVESPDWPSKIKSWLLQRRLSTAEGTTYISLLSFFSTVLFGLRSSIVLFFSGFFSAPTSYSFLFSPSSPILFSTFCLYKYIFFFFSCSIITS